MNYIYKPRYIIQLSKMQRIQKNQIIFMYKVSNIINYLTDSILYTSNVLFFYFYFMISIYGSNHSKKKNIYIYIYIYIYIDNIFYQLCNTMHNLN